MLGNDAQEQRAPVDRRLVCLQSGRKFELAQQSAPNLSHIVPVGSPT